MRTEIWVAGRKGCQWGGAGRGGCRVCCGQFSHSPALQLLPVLGHAAQPAPAGQAAAGGVEHVEAIAVSDARHLAEQAAAAEEVGGDVAWPGEAA
jgi:hypothetical protein